MRNKKLGLLKSAANFRHGIVLPYSEVPLSPSDITELYNYTVPLTQGVGSESASGGISYDRETAIASSIGEALERYAPQMTELDEYTSPRYLQSFDIHDMGLFSDEQIQRPDFPYKQLYDKALPFTTMFDLYTNKPVDVVAPLVSMTASYGHNLITSNGLAAGQSAATAILVGLQELLERDAFMSSWLHGIAGVRVDPPERLEKWTRRKGGTITCIDLTQHFNPLPVAMVIGNLPIRGKMRYSLGLACRASWQDAIEKAYAEWVQGTSFISHKAYLFETKIRKPKDAIDFDRHAVFYTLQPDLWPSLPIFRSSSHHGYRRETLTKLSTIEKLKAVANHLHKHRIRIFYRDLTSIDLNQIGVSAVRVVSPDLRPIHANHNWPFLGGDMTNIQKRYPYINQPTLLPNPFPHPLG